MATTYQKYRLVGGTTNERMKDLITKKYGIRSLVYFDRETRTIKRGGTYDFATVKELRLTLSYLEHYPLSK